MNEFYDLRSSNGVLKGTVGECMLKLAKPCCALTCLTNKERWFNYFSKYLTSEQIFFLDFAWTSLDCVEVIDKDTKPKIYLYESKTVNAKYLHYRCKPDMTINTIKLYEEALKLGFLVKIVLVLFHVDWKYSLEFKDFSELNYRVAKQKFQPRVDFGTYLLSKNEERNKKGSPIRI